MREILFRGKRVDNGEWVEDYFIQKGSQTFIASYPYFTGKVHETSWLEFCFGGFIEVIPETVGQFTGLTDKNGKKIFEGDICEFDNDEPDENERYTNYAVQWDCVNCQYVVVDGRNCEDCLDIFFAKHAEVIGNIHDNPELLEVGE